MNSQPTTGVARLSRALTQLSTGLLLALCLSAVAHAQGSHAFAFTVNADKNLGAANSKLLGTNLEWFNFGDSVLTGQGTHRTSVSNFAASQKPTVLRYWAGDLYEWYRGMPGQMAPNVVPFGNYAAQQTWFGTQQFLEFSKAIGASSMITLNVYQGWTGGSTYAPGTDAVPAIHASGWVEQIKSRVTQGWPSSIPGQGNLNGVSYWEVGNEPYLVNPVEAGAPNGRSISPSTFAVRAASTAQAVIANDASAKVLLPLSPGIRNGKAASAYWQNAAGAPDTHYYVDTILNAMPNASIDAISLHTAYMPVADAGRVDGSPNADGGRCPTTYYWSAMASAASVAANLDVMTARVKARYGNRFRTAVPQYALTEYAPVFAFGLNQVFANTAGPCAADSFLGHTQTDLGKWGATPAGALYVADLLRMLAGRTDVMTANHWSLHNNQGPDGANRFGGFIDTPDYQNQAQPMHQVLKLWASVLVAGATRVEVLATSRQTQTTDSIGYAEARTIPIVEAFATRYTAGADNYLAVLVINKDPLRRGAGRLSLKGVSSRGARIETLSSDRLLHDDGHAAFVEQVELLPPSGGSVQFAVPPGSVSVVTIQV